MRLLNNPYTSIGKENTAAFALERLLTKREKTLDRILRGSSDANINFNDLRSVLLSLGFQERINASHHIFSHPDLNEIINLQPKKGKAKPYQVKQIRTLITASNLLVEPDSEQIEDEHTEPQSED